MAAQQPQPQPSSSPSPSPAHRDLNPDDYGGLQVVEQGLEVAEPRQGLSQSKTWEQHSALPEVSTTSYPEVYHDAKPAELGNHPALAGQGAPGGYGGYAGLPTPSTGVVSPDHAYLGGRNPYDQTPPGRRICGLRKNVFWAILAIGIFAIVAAVAIGVGVGIGTRNSNDSAASASNTTTPSSTNSTSTNTLPAATSTESADAEVTITCPSDNRTLYTMPDDASRKFLVLCGRDYNEADGAADLYSANITTFAGCLTECAAQEGCTAVGWGNYYGTNTCWLKSQIGEPNWSASWYAAVEDDSG